MPEEPAAVRHQGFEAYEVFAQTAQSGAFEHQFSLLAGSAEMAIALARENFLRRREIFGLWVVRRADIVAAPLDDENLLFRLPKSYREVDDYRYLIDKWRRYQQKAMTPESMA